MSAVETIRRARESFARQSWGEARAGLLAAEEAAPLEVDDLERLAMACYMAGNDAEATDHWMRAYAGRIEAGEPERAARCAFHVVMSLLDQGELAQAQGWLGRGLRVIEGRDCVERGYFRLPAALRAAGEGDIETAYAEFSAAAEEGARFGDLDLTTLARMGRGRALIGLGRTAEGMALLDEVMVAVTAADVSPMVVGVVYCSVIDACHGIFDLRRAQEWTEALSRWCASQPGIVAYRGECLVRRAEIMQLHGAWEDALAEADRACAQLSVSAREPALGAAFYQRGEGHRLRGEFDLAEVAYREASRLGRAPEPGLALLRLAQGQPGAAAAAIRRALDEDHDHATRCRLLSAYIEIMLAVGEVERARAASDELTAAASSLDAAFLNAIVGYAAGSVLLAEGDGRGALGRLRSAWTEWQELEAPYEAARVRVLIGQACRQLQDEATAEMEFDAARWVFERLGAAPALAWVDALSMRASAAAGSGLTARELEVLRLVAGGKTNRAVAQELFISEKTVARHVSNIFAKLGVSSRAAATAYAYEHELL